MAALRSIGLISVVIVVSACPNAGHPDASGGGGQTGGGTTGGSGGGAGGGGPAGGGEGGGSAPTDAGPQDAGPIDAGPADLVGLPSDGGVMIEWRVFDAARCDVTRGCTQMGDRALLRFTFRIANVGGAPIDLTVPDAGLLTEACSGMPATTLRQFAEWDLLGQGSAVLASGFSDVHCLADDESMGGAAQGRYTCSGQGLSAAFASVQPTDGVCSWPDVSGLDAGVYSLRLKINSSRTISEGDYDNNELTVPVELPDTRCRGTWCGAMCCPPNVACNPATGGCGLPDLIVDRAKVVQSVHLSLENFNQWSCAVREGCLDGTGNRLLLRFTANTPNVGDGDFYIGPPQNNPRAVWSNCHMHYHYNDFAMYRLLSADGGTLVTGHKQAFCAFDDDPVWPDAGAGKYTCMNQGISVGWSDTYDDWLECQWIDVTTVAPGNYQLEVSVNPTGVIAEKDYSNNVVRVPVVIPP